MSYARRRPSNLKYILGLINDLAPSVNRLEWAEQYFFNFPNSLNGMIPTSVSQGPQCDQMEKLFSQYLAIYFNENMPNTTKNSQSGFKEFGQVWSHWSRCWSVPNTAKKFAASCRLYFEAWFEEPRKASTLSYQSYKRCMISYYLHNLHPTIVIYYRRAFVRFAQYKSKFSWTYV